MKTSLIAAILVTISFGLVIAGFWVWLSAAGGLIAAGLGLLMWSWLFVDIEDPAVPAEQGEESDEEP